MKIVFGKNKQKFMTNQYGKTKKMKRKNEKEITPNMQAATNTHATGNNNVGTK